MDFDSRQDFHKASLITAIVYNHACTAGLVVFTIWVTSARSTTAKAYTSNNDIETRLRQVKQFKSEEE
jgi:hypothetical protein